VNGREAARSGEWAQHFSNASCCILCSHNLNCQLDGNLIRHKQNCFKLIKIVFKVFQFMQVISVVNCDLYIFLCLYAEWILTNYVPFHVTN